jgi:hypothetical protein
VCSPGGLAPSGVADVGDEEVRVGTAGLGGELLVLISGNGVLLHHGIWTHVVGETGAVGVPIGLVEHGVRGTQEPKLSGDGFCGQHCWDEFLEEDLPRIDTVLKGEEWIWESAGDHSP